MSGSSFLPFPPTTVGVAIEFICQNISLSEGENLKDSIKSKSTTSEEITSVIKKKNTALVELNRLISSWENLNPLWGAVF